MASYQQLNHDYIKSILNYNPSTGKLTWKMRDLKSPHWNAQHAGKVAGCIKKDGYVQVRIDGHTIPAHRLIFFYQTGEWPTAKGDHRDGNPGNNQWTNLRAATGSQNAMNRKVDARNRVGQSGVRWNSNRECWTASITCNKVTHNLGRFDTLEDALSARRAAETRLFGEWSRTANAGVA